MCYFNKFLLSVTLCILTTHTVFGARGHETVSQSWIRYGKESSKEEWLFQAIQQDSLSDVKQAIRAGADIHNSNHYHGNLLHLIMHVGGPDDRLRIFRYLLSLRDRSGNRILNVNELDYDKKDGGKTPIQLAAASGKWPIFMIELLRAGATIPEETERDIELRDKILKSIGEYYAQQFISRFTRWFAGPKYIPAKFIRKLPKNQMVLLIRSYNQSLGYAK